jgi:hypothetical protein
VARVEVSVDDGESWNDAMLLPGPSPQVWTIWVWNWAAPSAGQHRLKARATSGSGQTQVDDGGFLADVFPNGTTSIHSVLVTV